ncbi:MAG: MgtC/SapB family protein [Phascolarctobacterium sp.]|uniref:MgtC/SapB family protein n=1 Tax=Phascolarctobacterium sp. TaxID=2049039 RepID=UPI0026DC73DB|nr:MgtC/SapB family protein [Phascolarctobacterium sp.]MDO4922352.1 MgtC/SapB family protein [Phascolarctobacterium sp.]
MFENIPWLHSQEVVMVVRLLAAAVLGGIVGLERGSGDRPAGFRTHILVCVGSALFMLVSMYGFDELEPVTALAEGDLGQRRDSARIAAQVVSGIGFLGAGTILHEGMTIRGLTTAASLWMVSAIGLAVGSGMFFLSTVATLITMITLVTFHTWEKRFAATSRSDRRFVRVVTGNRTGAITDITGYLSLNSVQVRSLNVKKDKDKNCLVIDLYLKIGKTAPEGADIVRGLQGIDGVISVENAK